MAELNREEITKLKRGERVGNVATAFCAAVLVYFVVGFALSRVYGYATLEVVTYATAPALMVVGIAVSAFCNFRYGGALEKLIRAYVRDVLVENAEAMHPERKSLTFYIEIKETSMEMRANAYKERVVFDFSAFGKFTAGRKLTVLNEIERRLCVTYCRLYERGAAYESVGYAEYTASKKKSGKVVYIIKDGVPEKRAYRRAKRSA